MPATNDDNKLLSLKTVFSLFLSFVLVCACSPYNIEAPVCVRALTFSISAISERGRTNRVSESLLLVDRSKQRKLQVRKSRPPFDPMSGRSLSMRVQRLPPCQSGKGASLVGRSNRAQNPASSSETWREEPPSPPPPPSVEEILLLSRDACKDGRREGGHYIERFLEPDIFHWF